MSDSVGYRIFPVCIGSLCDVQSLTRASYKQMKKCRKEPIFIENLTNIAGIFRNIEDTATSTADAKSTATSTAYTHYM